MQIIIPVAPSI